MPAPKYLTFLTCPRCSSTDLKRHGTHPKGTEHFGEQLVKCKRCGYKSYVTNFGGFDLKISPISPEQREIERQKRRNSRLNKTASDITKQRMSESHKKKTPYRFGKIKNCHYLHEIK
jgi:transposase-like protein